MRKCNHKPVFHTTTSLVSVDFRDGVKNETGFSLMPSKYLLIQEREIHELVMCLLMFCQKQSCQISSLSSFANYLLSTSALQAGFCFPASILHFLLVGSKHKHLTVTLSHFHKISFLKCLRLFWLHSIPVKRHFFNKSCLYCSMNSQLMLNLKNTITSQLENL